MTKKSRARLCIPGLALHFLVTLPAVLLRKVSITDQNSVIECVCVCSESFFFYEFRQKIDSRGTKGENRKSIVDSETDSLPESGMGGRRRC